MSRFRVALSGDFRKADGSPTYPSFDLSPLTGDPGVEVVYVDAVDGVMPADGLAGCDALILLCRGSRPPACPPTASSPSWRASASATTASTSRPARRPASPW